MSIISTMTRDLTDKLKTVPALGDRVGVTLGGTEADPALLNMPAPFAWAVVQSSRNEDIGQNAKLQRIQVNYIVYLGLDYGKGESAFVDTQLTLIEDIARAVGSTVVGVPGPGRWTFEGMNLVHADPTRLTYALTFSAVAHYTPPTN